ncbi:MAG: amidohydrolase family protein [Acidobacteriia bacterium]|nr:amidohydrolase family protein [Terriglobia bacterium]
MPKPTETPRAELHTHLGGAVDPPILWSIAHRQGIRLPTKDYWEFEAMVTMGPGKRNRDLDEMHNRVYYWTELIQSSPEAISESVASVIGGGYRKCNLVLQELRFNPMFRNRRGERDLDHIILAATTGVHRTLIEYPQVRAGLILMMDRRLSPRENSIIVEKAIRYRPFGVVGVDLAGPNRTQFSMKEIAPLFEHAREAGLGITVHAGETGDLDELRYVVREIQPDRIGHGIALARDAKLAREVAEAGITLELCPTSNLKNGMVRDVRQLGRIVTALLKHGVRFTINTDGPEMYATNVYKEQELLRKAGILTAEAITRCDRWAFEASFLNGNARPKAGGSRDA